MSEFKDDDCLAYDMFAGEETDVLFMSNRMVTTRKAHKCVHCQGAIAPGERVRAQTERNNEEKKIMTFYVCHECCVAMALSWTDNGKAIDARVSWPLGKIAS
jgi:hypothetical protein